MLTFLIGSNSSTSINRQVSDWVQSQGIAPESIIDLGQRSSVPLYSIDFEKEHGIPDAIQQDASTLKASHTLVVFSPEHNGIIPAVFKNYMDWMSRHERAYLEETQVVIVTASPGKGGGARAASYLETMLPRVGAHVAGAISIASFGDRKTTGELMTSAEFKKLEDFTLSTCA